MSVLARGIKNSVRNPVRALAVVTLLGVAMAFALSLMLSNQAVKAKLGQLKSSGATILTVSPAGQSFGPNSSGGGEPLTDALLEKVKSVEHVTDVGATLSSGGFGRSAGATPRQGQGGQLTFTPPESEIDLESPIDAGTLGRRQAASNDSDSQDIPDFKIPVQATGVSGNLDGSGKNYGVTSLVEQLTPGEYLLLRHSADTQDSGKGERDKEWTGGKESYSLSENDGVTTLVASFDVPLEMEEYFQEHYPKALAQVKDLSEKAVND